MRQWERLVAHGLLGCAAVLAQSGAPADIGPAGPYRAGAGDVLEISVFEVDELGKTVTVGSQGTIVLPLLGEVEVEGLTPTEIAARLEQLYGESLLRDPQINVVVKEYRSQPVNVLGAVARPGIYQLQGRRRLLEVLAMAGGLTKEAGRQVRITRQRAAARGGGGEASAAGGPREEIVVAVEGLLSGPGTFTDNPWIEPYDVVRVAESGLIYVLGAVARPGGYPIEQESMTVLRAISLAQGLDRSAAAQKARLIRQTGSERQEVAIRIGDILRGLAPDAALEDNDILFVPDSRAKTALRRGAEAAIQLATGVVIWRR